MAQHIDQDLWERLWRGIRELSDRHEGRLVFIGGIAVYLHVKEDDLPKGFIEYSHDGDFYISLSDYSALRDAEEVTINRRLDKHQIIKHGVEFDVYLENQNSLLVKYEDVAAESTVIDRVRVACLEHLLLLKLDAYDNRRGSAKGGKDERDLVRIVYLLNRTNPKPKRLSHYLTKEKAALLMKVQRSDAFKLIAEGNLHQASKLRDAFARTSMKIAQAVT